MKYTILALGLFIGASALAASLSCKVENNANLLQANSSNSAVAFFQLDLQTGKASFVVKIGGPAENPAIQVRQEQVTDANPRGQAQVRLSFSDVDHHGDSFAVYMNAEVESDKVQGYVTRVGAVNSAAPSESNYDKFLCYFMK